MHRLGEHEMAKTTYCDANFQGNERGFAKYSPAVRALAESFLGSKIQRHQDLDGNTAAAVVEFIDANDLAQ